METKTTTICIKDLPSFKYCKLCIICGDSVPLDELEDAQMRAGNCVHSKVCDKCKRQLFADELNFGQNMDGTWKDVCKDCVLEEKKEKERRREERRARRDAKKNAK